jgi:hypothetical protein
MVRAEIPAEWGIIQGEINQLVGNKVAFLMKEIGAKEESSS